MAKLDFNQPVEVIVNIDSPVADFNTKMGTGWLSKINLSFLPPYENTPKGVALLVGETLEGISVVPFDNMGGFEPIAEEVEKHLKELVKKSLSSFMGGTNETSAVIKDKDGVILEYSFKVVQREMNERVATMFEEM